MKGHNVLESFLLSSPPSLSPSIPMPSSKMPFKKKRSSTDEGVATHQNKSNSNSNNNKQHNNPQQHTYSSPASLVVCGVDGTVFTLDAYSGQLRGMFASGPALVFSSDVVGDHRVDGASGDPSSSQDHEYGYDSEGASTTASVISSSPTHQGKERVVPGLDGSLYSLFEQESQDEYIDDEEDHVSPCHTGDMVESDDFFDAVCNSQYGSHDGNNVDGSDSLTNGMSRMDRYNLQPLHISVMDVVDSPLSTCRSVTDSGEADEGQQRRQCGIVVGSKKTTIYAIDPMTGKVRWTQDPHGGAGAKVRLSGIINYSRMNTRSPYLLY
jgi:hypothetical protein